MLVQQWLTYYSDNTLHDDVSRREVLTVSTFMCCTFVFVRGPSHMRNNKN